MTTSNDRLDRIEALMEALAKQTEINERKMEATNQQISANAREIQAIGQITSSNAKSIEALTHQMNQDREDARKYREVQRKDRAHVFEWMARLAAAQADYYEAQADYLQHVEQIDDRLAEILNRLTPPTAEFH